MLRKNCTVRFNILSKLQVVQQLNARHYSQLLEFAGRMEILPEVLNAVVIISDQAHFYLNGLVNKQNSHYLGF